MARTRHTLRGGYVSMTQDQVSHDYIPQNCVLSPSPPDATGTKSAFALQLAGRGPSVHYDSGSAEQVASVAPPQLQLIVVDASQ
jgi:hypothetical protein